MKLKRQSFEIQLCSIGESNNPAQRPVEFILHDFEVSHNNTLIKKETAQKALNTLKNMPIVCKYYEVSEPNANDDALGSHEAYIDEDRNGNLTVKLDTISIGVFTEPAYIDVIIDENGNEKEVVKGKGILWSSRYSDIVGLLDEWWSRGIPIKSSMEILYDEYHFKDGVEEILNYVFEGHCILNSEQRGNHDIVLPAYDVSQITHFQRLVAEAINRENKLNNEKEEVNVKFQKVFELSHSDIRSLLYTELSKYLTEEEYNYSWITEVWDDRFIYEIWIEGEGTKYYEVPYSKSEDSVSVNFDSKVEVKEKREWVKVTEVQTLQAQLEEKNNELESFKTKLNEVNSLLESIKQEKESLLSQFNEATEKLTSLNSLVEELKPFKEKFETEQYEKALNERKEYYSLKFSAVNAKEKFESEEVQDLIKLSLNDNDEGRNAILKLNSMLVDLVQPFEQKNESPIREFSSKMENLLPASDDFDSKYSA